MRTAFIATADVVIFALIAGAGIWLGARCFPIFDVSPWSNVLENTLFTVYGFVMGRFWMRMLKK